MPTGVYPEPSGKAFASSVITHGIVIGVIATSGLFSLAKSNFGSPESSSGTVGVQMVKTIPIPQSEGPVNALASDTKSIVPQAPAPVKLQKQVKAEPENAIALQDKAQKKKLSLQQQMAAYYKPPARYKSNQVFAHTPQAASSAMFGMKGSSGIDLGPASVLGERCGAYVDLMTDRISQHWNRASVSASPWQKSQISFRIAQNGAVSNVQVAQPSGNYLLDTSAQRAVMDASPLPPLPAQCQRSEVTVDLWFQLKL
ncbi:MAG: TonB family protein [Acidobacteriota bacterium]|nr:TonB family protein [Acidobacteriota bacterium]